MGKNFFVVIILLLICIDAFAQTYYVRPAANGGSDANDGRSPATAFATIGHFAQIAVTGDIGNVASGTYNESNITFANPGVTVLGNGTVVVNSTTTVFNLNQPNTRLAGLTVTSAIPKADGDRTIIPVIKVVGAASKIENCQISQTSYVRTNRPENNGFTPSLYIAGANNVILSSNAITNINFNSAGVHINSSENVILTNNSIDSRHYYSVYIQPTATLTQYNHSIDTTNKGSNGLPIYYLYNVSNQEYDNLNVDEIWLANCSNLTFRNVTMLNADGIYLVGTTSSTIHGLTFTRTKIAGSGVFCDMTKAAAINSIHIVSSKYVTMKDISIIVGGRHDNGIYLEGSTSNCIIDGYTFESGFLANAGFFLDSHSDWIDLYENGGSHIIKNCIVNMDGWSPQPYAMQSSNNNLYENIIATNKGGSDPFCLQTRGNNCIFNNLMFDISGSNDNDTGPAAIYINMFKATDTTTILDSYLRGTGISPDVNHSGIGTSNLINTTLYNEKLTLGGGTIYRKWYLDILVKNSSGNPIAGATVTGKDKNGNQIFSVLSGIDGRVKKQLLTEYAQNASSQTYHTPYTITANYNGKTAALDGVNLDKNWYRSDPAVPLKIVVLNIDTGGGYIEGVFTGSISGIVRDTQNNPLSGMTVSVGGILGQTDSNGNYLLSNVVTGIQQVQAAKTGYVTQTKQVTVIKDQVVTLDFVVEISTAPVPDDTVPPTIAINSPADGTMVNQANITIDGTAADNVGLSRVEVKVGNSNWQAVVGTTSWSKALILLSGSNTIYARATDNSTNVQEISIKINYNPPAVNEPLAAKIEVYPNPYINKTNAGRKINFANLPKEAALRIYGLSGELIKELTSNTEGKAEWDVSEVKSGIYFYVISSAEGVEKGKVSVVK